MAPDDMSSRIPVAKELNVPILLLAQLNGGAEKRAEDDHRPDASRPEGIRRHRAGRSGLFLFREEVYKPEAEHLKGTAELIVAKQRNGPIGSTDLVWLREFTKFEDRTAWLEKSPS